MINQCDALCDLARFSKPDPTAFKLQLMEYVWTPIETALESELVEPPSQYKDSAIGSITTTSDPDVHKVCYQVPTNIEVPALHLALNDSVMADSWIKHHSLKSPSELSLPERRSIAFRQPETERYQYDSFIDLLYSTDWMAHTLTPLQDRADARAEPAAGAIDSRPARANISPSCNSHNFGFSKRRRDSSDSAARPGRHCDSRRVATNAAPDPVDASVAADARINRRLDVARDTLHNSSEGDRGQKEIGVDPVSDLFSKAGPDYCSCVFECAERASDESRQST